MSPCPKALCAVLVVLALTMTGFGADGRNHKPAYDFMTLQLERFEVPNAQVEEARLQARFTLHGLWPDWADGSWPSYCRSDLPFEYDSVASLFSDLNAAWPDLCHLANGSSFWKHEWDKHGTCAILDSPVITDEYSYFKETLLAFAEQDVDNRLNLAGIDTESDNPVSFSVLVEALPFLPYQGALVCSHKNGREVVKGLFVCYSKGMEVIDCPEAHMDAHSSQHCKDTEPIYFQPAQVFHCS